MKRSFNLDCNGKSNKLLINIIKSIEEANIYCCLEVNYQENEKFIQENIEFIYQNFTHPTYRQFNMEKFCSGLSIIDALMNIGFDGVEILLRK